MNKNDILLIQIERFIKYLKKLDDVDFNNLGIGLMKIEFAKRYLPNADEQKEQSDTAYIYQELQQANTREEVIVLLEARRLKKKDLESLLDLMDVHYNKKDNKQKLQSKIAEITVGTKLRLDAIKKK